MNLSPKHFTRKAEAIEYAAAQSHTFIIRTEYPSQGFMTFGTADDFITYMESRPAPQRCFYEFMQEDTPRKFYFDVEYMTDEEESSDKLDTIVEKLDEYFAEFFDIQTPDWEIATSSGMYDSAKVEVKNSFHVLLKGYFMPNYFTMRKVVDHMKVQLADIGIDFAPYGKTQGFRIFGCTKRAKKAGDLARFKREFRGSSNDIKDHLVTFLRCEEELPMYTFFAKTNTALGNLPRRRGVKRKRPSEDSGCHGSIRSDNEDDDVLDDTGHFVKFNFFKAESLLALLDESFYNTYEKWIRIGMSLKKYGEECSLLFHEFSQQSDKYDAKECEEKWRSFPIDSQVSCQTLIHEARRCNPDAVDDIFAHVKTPVQSKYMKATFGYERLREILRLVDDRDTAERITIQFIHATTVFVLNSCNSYYMMKEGPNKFQKIDVAKYEKSMLRHMCAPYKNSLEEAVENMVNNASEKIEVPMVEPAKLHNRIQNKITHDAMIFDPTQEFDDNRRVINRFMGYNIKRCETVSGELSDKAAKILDHCRDIICNNESLQVHRFFFLWLNKLLNHPGKQTEICLVLHSLPGCGKNIFTHLLRRVIGTEYTYETTEDRLFQKFNMQMENRVLVIANELATSGMTKKYADRLKDLITRSEIEVESKGVNTEVVPNFANYVLTTNNIDALKIDSGDRRMFVLTLSDEKRGNTEYFRDLGDAIEDDDVVREFLAWLDETYPISEWDPRTLPMTRAKMEMMLNEAPLVIQFIIDNKHLFMRGGAFDGCCIEVNAFIGEYKTWLQLMNRIRNSRLQKRQVMNDLRVYMGATTPYIGAGINRHRASGMVDFKTVDYMTQQLQNQFGNSFKWE